MSNQVASNKRQNYVSQKTNSYILAANQSILEAGAGSPISWAVTTLGDNLSGILDPAGGSALTVEKAGLFLISYQIFMTGSAATDYRASVRLNGSTIEQACNMVTKPTQLSNAGMSGCLIKRLAVGDVIRTVMFHNGSGGALDAIGVTGNASQHCLLEITFVQ